MASICERIYKRQLQSLTSLFLRLAKRMSVSAMKKKVINGSNLANDVGCARIYKRQLQ